MITREHLDKAYDRNLGSVNPVDQIRNLGVDLSAWERLVDDDTEATMAMLQEMLGDRGQDPDPSRPITIQELLALIATQFHYGFVTGVNAARAEAKDLWS